MVHEDTVEARSKLACERLLTRIEALSDHLKPAEVETLERYDMSYQKWHRVLAKVYTDVVQRANDPGRRPPAIYAALGKVIKPKR